MQNQLPIVLAEMKKFAEDWARLQGQRRAQIAYHAVKIEETRPLEDCPRRLFVEATEKMAGHKEQRLPDGILDGFFGLDIE